MGNLLNCTQCNTCFGDQKVISFDEDFNKNKEVLEDDKNLVEINKKHNNSQCLYEKFGGLKGIKAVVDLFYKKVFADPNLAPFFSETNMKKQHEHQTNFICLCLGGPNKYSGRSMRDAHSNMNITDLEFNLVAQYLSESLTNFGVSDEDVNNVLKVVATKHDEILNI